MVNRSEGRDNRGGVKPVLDEGEKVLLDFLSYLVNDSGTVYFITPNNTYDKSFVKVDIQYFNNENLGDCLVLAGSKLDDLAYDPNVRDRLCRIDYPRVKYYKIESIKILYRVLLYCKLKGVKGIALVGRDFGGIDIDKAIYVIQYVADSLIN